MRILLQIWYVSRIGYGRRTILGKYVPKSACVDLMVMWRKYGTASTSVDSDEDM